MDEQIFSEFPKGFSEPLLAFCQAPEPEPAFIRDLERQLLERQAVLLGSVLSERTGSQRLRAKFSAFFAGRGWQYALVVLVAALTIALLAIGPQRVLAQVQRWLGYVPGIGFVNLDQARVLVEPVSISHDGVTLKVEQALAEPDETLIVFSSKGLPPENIGGNPSRFDNLPKPFLTLPDGSVLKAVRQELSYGGGKIEFPALPEGVFRVTFEIDRLPLLPSGAFPEGWQASLLLRPASGELADDLFPQPYSPKDNRTTVNGVTAHIQQVAQTANETALQVQFDWENPDWKFRSVTPPFELRDDRGNVYQQLPSNSQVSSASVEKAVASPANSAEPATSTSEATFRFPALSLAARAATLHLPSIGFMVPDAPGFTFDLGPDPQIGQAWEMNTALEVAGIPVQLTGARLVQDDQTYPGDPPLYGLEFTFHSTAQTDRALDSFFLNSDLEGYRGGGGGMREPGVFNVEMLFKQMPREPLHITFEGVMVTLYGPWDLYWQIPGVGQAVPPIREVHPEGIAVAQAGITLRVDRTTFTDQVSVVNLAADGLTAGGRLLNVLSFDPATFDLSQAASSFESQLYLETDQGQRVELAQNVSWQPEGEALDDPGRLVFGPLPPQTEGLTLHVPAVELFLSSQTAFEVDVPGGLNFHSEEIKVNASSRNEGQSVEPRTHWVSEPWEVDVPVEVAGFRLHFTQAQIERDLNASIPYRLILTSQPLNRELEGKSLSALSLSAVSCPDGRQDDGEEINALMRWLGLLYDRAMTENYDPANWQAKLFLDVSTEDGNEYLPGRYQVEIDGAKAWVSGPWELHFSLSGN